MNNICILYTLSVQRCLRVFVTYICTKLEHPFGQFLMGAAPTTSVLWVRSFVHTFWIMQPPETHTHTHTRTLDGSFYLCLFLLKFCVELRPVSCVQVNRTVRCFYHLLTPPSPPIDKAIPLPPLYSTVSSLSPLCVCPASNWQAAHINIYLSLCKWFVFVWKCTFCDEFLSLVFFLLLFV